MKGVTLRNPDALVSTEWLATRLGNPDLRIFDCSTVLQFEDSDKRPYRVLNCAAEHAEGHIPGAQCLDLRQDFSEDECPYGMTLADPATVAAAFERVGVGDGTRVVLYSRRSPSWATRFWWMLRWLGFDDASVLDGGFEKWIAEGRPLSTKDSQYPKGSMTIRLRPELFVGKEQVLTAMTDPATCLVNALGRDIFSGENPRYGRPGRIPGSVSVPKVDLVDPETNAFRPVAEIASIFRRAGADQATGHITYCGGAIFATVDAFWLYQLGHDNVAVYENSMSEWGPDHSLPMETN